MAYSKQTWDTTSYVNPTRMNHIEDGIESASTADGTDYSSGVSVKQKIDDISTWTFLGSFTSGGAGVDVSDYSELYIVPKMQGWASQNPFHFVIFSHNVNIYYGIQVNTNYGFEFIISIDSSGVFTISGETLRGWTSCVYDVYGKK